VASSSDGTRLIAVETGGRIYTSILGEETTAGTAGFISGEQFEAIALQYIGSDQFIVLSHSGVLTAN
jgi:hypothetical protein